MQNSPYCNSGFELITKGDYRAFLVKIYEDFKVEDKIYYVGKRISVTEWEMQGILTDKYKAVDAVILSDCTECFVASITVNEMLPIATVDIADCGDVAWYPLLEDEPKGLK